MKGKNRRKRNSHVPPPSGIVDDACRTDRVLPAVPGRLPWDNFDENEALMADKIGNSEAITGILAAGVVVKPLSGPSDLSLMNLAGTLNERSREVLFKCQYPPIPGLIEDHTILTTSL
jgi:hypothetical protein